MQYTFAQLKRCFEKLSNFEKWKGSEVCQDGRVRDPDRPRGHCSSSQMIHNALVSFRLRKVLAVSSASRTCHIFFLIVSQSRSGRTSSSILAQVRCEFRTARPLRTRHDANDPTQYFQSARSTRTADREESPTAKSTISRTECNERGSRDVGAMRVFKRGPWRTGKHLEGIRMSRT